MQKEIIAAGVLKGMPQTDIAKQIGMHQSTVSRAISKDDDVKALILGNYKRLITTALPEAVENLETLVKGFKTPIPGEYSKKDLQLKDQQYDATKYVAGMGLSASHAPSTVIQQNFIQNNTSNYVSPVIDKLLGNVLLDLPTQDVVIEGENAKDGENTDCK